MDISDKKEQFEKIAMPHIDALYSMALHLTGKKEDAEDLVQETYLKAFRFFDSFEGGTNFRAWIYKILKNNFINRYRKVSKEKDVESYDAEDFYLFNALKESEDKSPEAAVLQKFESGEIRQAVAELPPEYKEALVLCDMEGLSYEEISHILNCPVGTVRSRIHRGRRMLQKGLHEMGAQKGYFKKREGES